MDPLLIDVGSSCFKVGINLESVRYIYDIPDQVLDFNQQCTKIGDIIEMGETGTSKLANLLKFGRPEMPDTFLVSQHMDYEMKKDNFLKKTFEIYFEKHDFTRGQTWLQPLLAFYTLRNPGQNDMMIIDSGEDTTYFIPFYDDFIIKDCIERSPLAGKILTNHFQNFILRNGYHSLASSNRREIQALKEESLEVCPDYERFYKSIVQSENFYWRQVTLPDGSKLKLKNEVMEIPEILFRPADFGLSGRGLPEKMLDSIKVWLKEHPIGSENRSHE